MAGPDYFLVIDFEASGVEQDSKTWEIVEFPCVVVCGKRWEVLPNPFHRFVRPTTNPLLSEQCKQNCGIEQAWVDKADTIDSVVTAFVEWVGQNLPGSVACVTCGNYDLGTALLAESTLKSFGLPPWLRSWINIKVPFVEFFGGRPTGMKGMLSRLGLELQGRHHRGLDDAQNIARILLALHDQGVQLQLTSWHKPQEGPSEESNSPPATSSTKSQVVRPNRWSRNKKLSYDKDMVLNL